MEKKKPSLIKRILDYQFPWTKSLERKMEAQDDLMIAILKGDEEEAWRSWEKYRKL